MALVKSKKHNICILLALLVAVSGTCLFVKKPCSTPCPGETQRSLTNVEENIPFWVNWDVYYGEEIGILHTDKFTKVTGQSGRALEGLFSSLFLLAILLAVLYNEGQKGQGKREAVSGSREAMIRYIHCMEGRAG